MPFSTIPLNDGLKIPQIAFGTGSIYKGNDTHEAVEAAIQTGFRSIDTAQWYKNEQFVGVALSNTSARREQLFVTTKLGTPSEGEQPNGNNAVVPLKESLAKLKLGYVNLYLIHIPDIFEDLPAVWKSMIECQERGLAKSIGVSNFEVKHLKQLEGAKVVPAVNQIRLHPYLYASQKHVLEYAAKHGIIIEAYGSLASITRTPGGPVDPVVAEIAKAKGVSPAQVLFLWVRAKGAAIVTTTSKKERMEEYLATGDLTPLTPEEVAKIDKAGATPWDSPRSNLGVFASVPTLSKEKLSESSFDKESQKLDLDINTRAQLSSVRRTAFLGLAGIASIVVLAVRHCHTTASAR